MKTTGKYKINVSVYRLILSEAGELQHKSQDQRDEPQSCSVN